jgi:16S rRNA (cytidine1402-2'-O)-methyltransferase
VYIPTQDSLLKQDLPAACLYVVASPIGNLGDITLRALHVLNQVDGIACEDKRHSSLLLNHFSIHKSLMAVHEHNELEAAQQIVDRLRQGERWAYLSDAGTPGISDPGSRLVMEVRSHGFRVIPIPGVSALTAALSIAGELLIASRGEFRFIGFLPSQKNEFESALVAMAESCLPTVFYESPHRLAKTLLRISELFSDNKTLFIARELSKKFESVSILKPSQLLGWLENSNNHKGEFVLIFSGKDQSDLVINDAPTKLASLLSHHIGSKDLAIVLHAMYGLNKNEAYEIALHAKKRV